MMTMSNDNINSLLDGQIDETALTGEEALKALVGDGAKYKTVEELAKASVHAQKHIATIEAENAKLREDAAKTLALDELLAHIKKEEDNKILDRVQGDEQIEPPTQSALSQTDIEALLEKKLADREHRTQAARNKELVAQTLAAKLGASASEVYKSVGDSLGINLDELSEKSPQAVISLVTGGKTSSQSPSSLSGGLARDQGNPLPGQQPLTQQSINAQYAQGKLTLAEKHRLENEGIQRLGEAFYNKP